MKNKNRKEPAKKDLSTTLEGETSQQEADLRAREAGRKLIERLKAKGPNYDRLGQSFIIRVGKK